MERVLAFLLAFSFGFAPLAAGAQPPTGYAGAPRIQYESGYQPYTAEQLDNLLAPVALYPDPLLAQVLVAATFVDQIDEAARWVRSYGQRGVDDRPWDVSVRAVAHYPGVLNMMADNLDWTTAIGQAYVYQSTDVMGSIQRLRAMAQAQGNLVSTPQQEVIVESGYISIWPASPGYLYVPAYDPSIVFFRPVYIGGVFTAFSFGPALAIGVWLNLDCDWDHSRIYYTGWQGRGWIARSRPRIHVNARYVNPRFSTVAVNRRIGQRPVNYSDLARYRAIHRNVRFGGRLRDARPPGRAVPNKIIDRNIPPDQRLDQYRGRQKAVPSVRPGPLPARSPGQPRTVPRVQPRSPVPARAPHPVSPPPASARPAPAMPGARRPAARPPDAFGRGGGPFDPRAASQRGQRSRRQMQPKPAGKSQPKARQGSRQRREKRP